MENIKVPAKNCSQCSDHPIHAWCLSVYYIILAPH